MASPKKLPERVSRLWMLAVVVVTIFFVAAALWLDGMAEREHEEIQQRLRRSEQTQREVWEEVERWEEASKVSLAAPRQYTRVLA